MKQVWNIVTKRLFVTAFILLLEIAFLISMMYLLGSLWIIFGVALYIFSIAIILLVVNDNGNPAYKISWIACVILIPFAGGILYIIFGKHHTTKQMKKRFNAVDMGGNEFLKNYDDILNRLECNHACFQMAKWMWDVSKHPVYDSTSTEFLKSGEVYFKRLLEDLKLAKKNIFMEFFIISPGKMWGEVVSILAQKSKQGIDVRLIYDDFGTITTMPDNYSEYMNQIGIKTRVFNPVRPRLDAFMNNRDHRKIVVIDGNLSYTGGINLADEYINEKERFGYWQDCGIRLNGKATASFTALFLRMWQYLSNEEIDYEAFMPNNEVTGDGLVMPFGDNPIRSHHLNDSIYLKIITAASRYIYIQTPYLVMDYELTTALIFAAESGVDVRIVTPHIPDKFYVHAMTRSSYKDLIQAGVKIYEFTPGFIHSKVIISDDCVGVVGTANFDFRSLYLHFECSVWMYKTSSLEQIYKDFMRIIERSQKMTIEDCDNRKLIQKMLGIVLKPFAPLM